MEQWSRLIGDSLSGTAVLVGSWTSIINWLTCVSVAVFYTVMVFVVPINISEMDGPVLSKQHKQPLSVILIIHTAFLAAIICLICWAFHQFSPSDFGPDPSDIPRGDSFQNTPRPFFLFLLLFSFGLILLHRIERRWICVESGLESSDSANAPIERELIKDE